MTTAPLFLAIALLAYYVLRSVKTFSSLRHFGGHRSAGWSRIWLLRTQGSGQMNKIFTAVNDQYGKWTPSCECGAPFADLPNERRTCCAGFVRPPTLRRSRAPSGNDAPLGAKNIG